VGPRYPALKKELIVPGVRKFACGLGDRKSLRRADDGKCSSPTGRTLRPRNTSRFLDIGALTWTGGDWHAKRSPPLGAGRGREIFFNPFARLANERAGLERKECGRVRAATRHNAAVHEKKAILKGDTMRLTKVSAIAIDGWLCWLCWYGVPGDGTGASRQLIEEDPIEQYLMTGSGAEIALARSAAPESISREAEVLVLGRHGSRTRLKARRFRVYRGTSWTICGRMLTFWIPKSARPDCVNASSRRVPTFCAAPRSPRWLWRVQTLASV